MQRSAGATRSPRLRVLYDARMMHRAQTAGRSILLLVLLAFLASCTTLIPLEPDRLEAGKLEQIDAAIERAIDDGRIVGGLFFIDSGGDTYGRTYGVKATTPERETLTPD